MSANSAILERILESIEGLRTDVAELKTDVAELKTDVAELKTDVAELKTNVAILKKDLYKLTHEFNAYTKHESTTQEMVDVNKFLRAWENSNITPAHIFPLREFFRAANNSLLTDLDGCVLIGQPTYQAYIIESKHVLTVDDLLEKLGQFCEILDLLTSLRTEGKTWLRNQSNKFQTMVEKYDLERFPKNVYFMFAADSMTKDMQNYIQKINSGERQQNQIQQIARFKESDLYNQIQQSNVPTWVKENLAKATSVKMILQAITPSSAGLQDVKEEIMGMLTDTDPCFKQLQGRLGIMCLETVVWPTGNKTLSGMSGGKGKTKRCK
jgi:hypothetical protein